MRLKGPGDKSMSCYFRVLLQEMSGFIVQLCLPSLIVHFTPFLAQNADI